MRLNGSGQLDHHNGIEAFKRFLLTAHAPDAYQVRVKGRRFAVDGAILIWGATTETGRRAVMDECGFSDVLSLEAMLADLRVWKSEEWLDRVAQLRVWSDGLLGALL